MSVLLDTHAFVWALFSPELLSDDARLALNRSEHALVSTVSMYEIATKVRRGRWKEAEPLFAYSLQFFREQGFRFVDLSYDVAIRAGRMTGEHRDPFDRMLAATAIELDADIVSADAALDVFGVRRVW